jgi:hypothetical protein
MRGIGLCGVKGTRFPIFFGLLIYVVWKEHLLYENLTIKNIEDQGRQPVAPARLCISFCIR